MKCPECKANLDDLLNYYYEGMIDPAELLRLIEKAKNRYHFGLEILHATESYLSGDPEPLKKLAGE